MSRVPEGTRVYAIGDLHGDLDSLERMHAQIERDLDRDPAAKPLCVYLGDYIDRGPDSRDLLDVLIETRDRKDGIKRRFLGGNHESMFLEFLRTPVAYAAWLQWGGLETARSYGVEYDEEETLLPSGLERIRDRLKKALPSEHKKFLEKLEDLVVLGDYAFVHAGIRPGVPLSRQKPEDLRGIREPFLSHTEPFEKRVVHGHVIVREPEVLPNRIGVDTGLFTTGVLTCVVLESDAVRFLQVKRPVLSSVRES